MILQNNRKCGVVEWWSDAVKIEKLYSLRNLKIVIDFIGFYGKIKSD